MKPSSLSRQLAPDYFLDGQTYVTKSDDLVCVFSLPNPKNVMGWSEEDTKELGEHLNTAMRLIPPGAARHYQYVRKTTGQKVIRYAHRDPRVTYLEDLQSADLEQGGLARYELWHAILLKGPELAKWMPFSRGLAAAQIEEQLRDSLERLGEIAAEYVNRMGQVVGMKRLSESEIFYFLRALANGPREQDCNLEAPEEDIAFYMADEEPATYPKHLQFYDFAVRILTLKQAPRVKVFDPNPGRSPDDQWRSSTQPGIFAELLTVPGEWLVAMEYAPLTDRASTRRIVALQKNMNSSVTSMATEISVRESRKLENEPAVRNVKRLGEADAESDRGNYHGDFSFTFVAYGATDAEAKKVLDAGRNVLLNRKATSIREGLYLKRAWLAIFPGNHSLTGNLRMFSLPIDCYADLSLCYTHSSGRLNERGEYLSVFRTPDHQAHYFTPTKLFMAMMFGESGAGKSALTGRLTSNFQKNARKIDGKWHRPKTLIYDFGRSYEEITRYHGGEFKPISKGGEAGKQNPYALPADDEHIGFLTVWFRDLMTRSDGYAFNPDENAMLRTAIQNVFLLKERNPRMGRLGNMRLADDTPGRLGTRLEALRGGIFDTAEDTFSRADWQTFEFRGFEMSDAGDVASYLYLINVAWDQIYYDPELVSLPKLWVMDEAHIFMLSGNLDMGQRILDKVTTGRKNNLCCIFTMPWARTLAEVPQGGTLISACPIKIFTRSPGTARPPKDREGHQYDYPTLLGLKQEVADRIERLEKPGEALIHMNGEDALVKVEFDPYSLLLFSNDPETSERKRQAFKSSENRSEGLKLMAKEAVAR